MKIHEVRLYLEECCGRQQGGATLTLIDADGEMIDQHTSRKRNNLCALYRRLVNLGAKGEVLACHGQGGWMTNIRHDHYN